MQTIRTGALTRIGLAALFLVALSIIGLRLTGTATYAVMSGSMVPAISVGSLVVVRTADPASVRVRDVVTYELPDRVVTHRVIGIDEGENGRTFTTKGDANAVADPERIRFPKAVGLVQTAIPALGYFVVYAQAYWRLGALGLAAAVFLAAGAMLLFGHGQVSPRPAPKPAPRPAPRRAAAARRAGRLAEVQDESWATHLSWLRRPREVAA